MMLVPGARVHLAGLGTGTIREVRGRRYAVEIKGRIIIAAAGDLELMDPPNQPREKARDDTRPHPAAPAHAHPHSDEPSRTRSHLATPGRTRSHLNAPSRTRAHLAAPGHPCVSLDLHGKTAAEARDALEAFVNDALLEGCAQAVVVHGRSGGRVKAAVHHYLRSVSAVASFRVDPQNPGVTVVTFA